MPPVGSSPLSALLERRALGWAQRLELGAVERARPSEGVGEAAARVMASAADGEPLLIAWPELPRWRVDVGEAALDDLANRCAVSLGPVFDGRFYLLAVRWPFPSLFELDAGAWDRPDIMGQALAAAQQSGIEAGLLRAERGLRTSADIQAALADPLTDPELRELLVTLGGRDLNPDFRDQNPAS
jgi:glycosyltransferase A (GT-A) superfamily protein (DUF2064 family)